MVLSLVVESTFQFKISQWRVHPASFHGIIIIIFLCGNYKSLTVLRYDFILFKGSHQAQHIVSGKVNATIYICNSHDIGDFGTKSD